MAPSPILDGDVWWSPIAGDLAPTSRFTQLPAELRVKVWNCAVEPRVIPLNDLVHRPLSHRLPAVTQVNAEARSESRQGYEPVGRGSYFDFANDILLCDYHFSDQTAYDVLDNMAPEVKRAVFWDCIPDERVFGPDDYEEYLQIFYRQSYFGHILFNELWFPNVKELWLVKIADVDEKWMINSKKWTSFQERLVNRSKEFRYWVDERIIEMAPLDLDEPANRLVLGEGRCARNDCRKLNACRDHIVSKVNFLDGEYKGANDGRIWTRIQGPKVDEKQVDEDGQLTSTVVDRLRWLLTERTLTLLLRCEWPMSDEGEILVNRTKSQSF